MEEVSTESLSSISSNELGSLIRGSASLATEHTRTETRKRILKRFPDLRGKHGQLLSEPILIL